MPEKEMQKFLKEYGTAFMSAKRMDISEKALQELGLNENEIKAIHEFFSNREEITIDLENLAQFVLDYVQTLYGKEIPDPTEGLPKELDL